MIRNGLLMTAFRVLRFASVLGLLTGANGPAFADGTPPPGYDSFLSRVTVAVPFFTVHAPDGRRFNDDNWGGFVFVALNDQVSVLGGDFRNSYDRNTAVAAVSYWPINLDVAPVRIDMGGLVGVDLNNGYRGYNNLEPALGAFSLKLGSDRVNDADISLLERAGLLVTIIPGVARNTSTAFNLALTVRL